MDHRTAMLVAWLEGEGERRRQPFPLPPRVGDPAVRGWVQVGVCVLVGTLAGGSFVCWLGVPVRPDSLHATRSLAGPMTLERVRVEGIAREVKGDGARPLILIVRYRGLLLVCKFREANAPRDVRLGDTVSIRSATGRDEEETDRILLKDCEVVAGPIRLEE